MVSEQKINEENTEAEAKESSEFAASLQQKTSRSKNNFSPTLRIKDEYTKYSEQSNPSTILVYRLSFRQLISYTGDISLSDISSVP